MPMPIESFIAPSPRLPQVTSGADLARLQKNAREFEAVFLAQMLQPIVRSPDSAPPFGGGFAEDVWRDMLADAMGEAISRTGGIGVADAVLAQALADRSATGAPARETVG